MKEGPGKASWRNAEGQQGLAAAFAEDEDKRESPSVWRTLRDPRVLFLSLVYFLLEMGFYGLTFFLPSQVSRLLGKSVGLDR